MECVFVRQADAHEGEARVNHTYPSVLCACVCAKVNNGLKVDDRENIETFISGWLSTMVVTMEAVVAAVCNRERESKPAERKGRMA